MGYKFNPFTGTLDDVGAGGGGGTPGGSTTQVQFNDGGAFAGDADLVWNKTTNVLGITGDVNLSDGGTYTTTLQTITPTAARTISLPDATGTVALVAGSSGQLLWNNAGVNAGASTLTYDGSILTSSGRFINSYNATASSPAKAFTGTWFTGGTATTTKPQVLIEPTGATSTAWSTSGTGLGVNAASGFAGNLLDLQVNGTSRANVNSAGQLTLADGSKTAPAIRGTDADSGFFFRNSGNDIAYARGGVGQFSFDTGSFVLSSSVTFAWSSGEVGVAGGDLTLARDAANTLAQRNGTNAQTFRVYNTYTSSTNYELGKLEWASNVFRIGTEKGSGGGTARALEFQTDGTTRATISANGQTTFSSGVRLDSYLDFSTLGTIKYTAGGVLKVSNTAETDFNRLQFGGTTTSFPALKRNSAVLETKLADDSAYAQHAASVFQAATAHTVATLPGTPAVGMIARVTDATTPVVGMTVAGGGAAAALVWYNGTAWSVIGV